MQGMQRLGQESPLAHYRALRPRFEVPAIDLK